MKKYVFSTILALSFFSVPFFVSAATSVIKSPISDTVYFVDEQSVRHPFPNRIIYESWYGPDFSQVETVPLSEIAKLPLGKSIVARSGKYLLKVPTSPEVYAVEPGGVLRHIKDGEMMLNYYGEDWQDRLRDLPEVFFDHYTVGDPLLDVPDGTVYKVASQPTWYWKNGGIVEPFESVEAMYANGYELSDAIVYDKGYFGKRKPITGFSSRVFNPVLAANMSTSMCTTDSLHAAVIFLTKDSDISAKELQVLSTTVNQAAEAFGTATDGLSTLTIEPEFFVMQDHNNYMLGSTIEGRPFVDLEQVALNFYETAKDDYDFLIVYNDYIDALDAKEKAVYQLVRNDYFGTNRLRLNRSKFAGSNGRLKGFVNMHKIDQYSASTPEGVTSLLDLINHEIAHHWSGSVSYLNERDERSYTLLDSGRVHWSKWLTSVSPLGGWGWVRTEGTNEYTSGLVNRSSTALKKFTDLDLYLMGLIPQRYIEPITYLVPDNPDSVSDTATGVTKEVTIEQIINSHGAWRCDIIE